GSPTTASRATPAARPRASGHLPGRVGTGSLWRRTIGVGGTGRAADVFSGAAAQAGLYEKLRGAPQADDADDRGREARPECDVDARRALGPVRPDPAGVAWLCFRSGPGPVPAVQGARAGRLLRGAGGQGVHSRDVAA